MDLVNFGSVLTYAAEKEAADRKAYAEALARAELAGKKSRLEEILADLGKNEKDLLRARRENVTEMILEPIHDFSTAPFEMAPWPPDAPAERILAGLAEVERRAAAFYEVAMVKLGALPEVSRVLKKAGARRKANLEKL